MLIRVASCLLPVVFAASLSAQSGGNSGIKQSDKSGLSDPRPFGKFLVSTCTLSPFPSNDPNVQKFRCTDPSESKDDSGQAQKIEITKVTCTMAGDGCSPVFPGDTITVSAKSDSKSMLPVKLQALSGGFKDLPTSKDSQGSTVYSISGTVTAPGPVAVRATQEGLKGKFAPAVPVEVIISVMAPAIQAVLPQPASAKPAPSPEPSCPGLPASTDNPQTSDQTMTDLTGAAGLIGNPTPFTLVPQGTRTLLIYSSRFPLRPDEEQVLRRVPYDIETFLWQSATSVGATNQAAKSQPFNVEILVPHAAALGSLADRVNSLNFDGITAKNVGTDRVRINATKAPNCATWAAFLRDFRSLVWSVIPEPLDLKLFYLSSTDAATAFTAVNPSGSGNTTTPGSNTASPGGNTTTGGNTASPGGNTTTSGGNTASPGSNTASPSGAQTPGGSPAASAASVATISVTQPPGSIIELTSNTTPCVVAGLNSGNSNACGATASSGSQTGSPSSTATTGTTNSQAPANASAAATPKPIGMASMGVAAGTGEQNPSDLLVFSDTNPGDDAQVTERKRILAQLDLPRPEMLINAWVLQNSTADPAAIGKFSTAIRDMVARYNSALELVVLNGWHSIRTREKSNKMFFDAQFYGYINNLYIAAPPAAATSTGGNPSDQTQEAVQQFLGYRVPGVAPADGSTSGYCTGNQYCLGFNDLFQPLKPRLTDLLLTLIATAVPPTETNTTIDAVEGAKNPVKSVRQCAGLPDSPESGRMRERCREIWSSLGLERSISDPDCATADYENILGSLVDSRGTLDLPRPRIYLSCFREETGKFFGANAIGILRGAIADFLFNYKMSQQYPHEFSPYDLSQSADALNSALAPVIDAFNRDIVAFQTFMRADVQFLTERLNEADDKRCCIKRLLGMDKPSFFNDGLVTVRTISGQQGSVNTTSQSALDNSSAPSIAALLNNMATPPSSSSTMQSPLAAVLGTAQANPALLAAVLDAYQSSSVQIGRMLNLQVTPRSLSTASSAELNVQLMADETSTPPAYTGPAPQNTSRVATHDTTTRVRVESVKLFELSSLSAVLERSRSRFPLLPPFVEIPYIGTLAGIPIPPAKEYHSSTAMISAMVVPTASDIAYGLRFQMDRIIESGDQSGASTACYIAPLASSNPPCRLRRALSLHDFTGAQIRNYHRARIKCFEQSDLPFCSNLSFDTVPHDAN